VSGIGAIRVLTTFEKTVSMMFCAALNVFRFSSSGRWSPGSMSFASPPYWKTPMHLCVFWMSVL
jgi:hypothetical protein